jgi:CheY-like chemotaxis protein
MQTPDEVKTILIADDDVDFLEQTRFLLEQAGFRVVAAESQAQAEELLAKELPDLAILDLMMEHNDSGFVLAHRIKSKDSAVPVILTTAVTSQTGFDFDAGKGLGSSWVKADVIIDKPVRFEQIMREIERLLKA